MVSAIPRTFQDSSLYALAQSWVCVFEGLCPSLLRLAVASCSRVCLSQHVVPSQVPDSGIIYVTDFPALYSPLHCTHLE